MSEVSQNGTIREILTGSGLTMLIIMLSVFIPAAVLAIPFPVFLYRLKIGRNHGAKILLIAVVFLLILSGGISPDVFFISTQLVVGFLMGGFFEKGFPVDKTILCSCGTILTAGTAAAVAFTLAAGESPFSVVLKHITSGIGQLKQLKGEINISDETIQTVSEMMAAYFPSIMMVALFLSCCITFMMFRIYLRRKKKEQMIQISFSEWKTPDLLVWLVIASALSLMIPADSMKIIGINLLIIFMTSYLLQGFIIVTYFFDRFKFPKILKYVLYFVIVIQNFTLIGVIALGFFDTWFNFRHPGTKQLK